MFHELRGITHLILKGTYKLLISSFSDHDFILSCVDSSAITVRQPRQHTGTQKVNLLSSNLRKYWTKYIVHQYSIKPIITMNFLRSRRSRNSTKKSESDPEQFMVFCLPIRFGRKRNTPTIDQENNTEIEGVSRKEEIPAILQENIKKAMKDSKGCVQVYRVHRSNENLKIFHSNATRENAYVQLTF